MRGDFRNITFQIIYEGRPVRLSKTFEHNSRYASPSYERVLGISANWYTGKPGIVVVHQADREKVVSAFQKAVRSKKTVQVEYLKRNIARDDYLEVESLLILSQLRIPMDM
ncbi:PAS domain-containing protein [Alicyclobacillus dauci]|uniref:PAS domain-containing protein n=1 Tax=Alicyclobacillus dauci TaxID=1475485 RepID=UPI0038992A22